MVPAANEGSQDQRVHLETRVRRVNLDSLDKTE